MAHGPEPGTILNETGVPTEPRQAATVLVLRGGSERLEVLLAQRTPKAKFMGGAWVFPGGAVDSAEIVRGPTLAGENVSERPPLGHPYGAHRAAGVREVQEEVGITLPDPDALVP